MPRVVSDTSPLVYLHRVGRLDLLQELFGTVLVPMAVVAELQAGRRVGADVPDPLPVWCEIVAERPSLDAVAEHLDAGEREALAVAVETDDALILLDDGEARREADRLEVSVTGTLGVLLRAKERDLLTEVTPVVDRLQRLGFRLSARARAAVLALAGE